jgi:hypothetical protein
MMVFSDEPLPFPFIQEIPSHLLDAQRFIMADDYDSLRAWLSHHVANQGIRGASLMRIALVNKSIKCWRVLITNDGDPFYCPVTEDGCRGSAFGLFVSDKSEAEVDTMLSDAISRGSRAINGLYEGLAIAKNDGKHRIAEKIAECLNAIRKKAVQEPTLAHPVLPPSHL